MGNIIIDSTFESQVSGVTQLTELKNSDGQSIGAFVPASQLQSIIYKIAGAQCPYSPEEIKQSRFQTGGMTLAEFWKSVGRK